MLTNRHESLIYTREVVLPVPVAQEKLRHGEDLEPEPFRAEADLTSVCPVPQPVC